MFLIFKFRKFLRNFSVEKNKNEQNEYSYDPNRTYH